MSSLRIFVLVLSLATSSIATEKTSDYGIDAFTTKNDGSESVETFGSRGSGYSESSLDDPNNVYYHNERTRVARAVLEEEEGSSLSESDSSKPAITETTRTPDLSHLSTPPKIVLQTKQVTNTEKIFRRRSLLTIDLTNPSLTFDHRSPTPQLIKKDAPGPKTTKTPIETITSTVVPETIPMTMYDDLLEEGLQPIVRRTKAKRARGDNFEIPTGEYTSYVPTRDPTSLTPSTIHVTESFSVESSTDDNIAISIRSIPIRNDASTIPVTRTHTTSVPKTSGETFLTPTTLSNDINKISETIPPASAVIFTQSAPPVAYVSPVPLNFVDPDICTHTPDETFDITLFREVIFSRVDCSGHVAIFDHNTTLDSGLSASLFLTIYKRLHLGGLIMTRLADELNDYIYRPADFV